MVDASLIEERKDVLKRWLAGETIGWEDHRVALRAVLDDHYRLLTALAERDAMLAVVARDDTTGVGEMLAAREREAIAKWMDGMDLELKRLSLITRAIRARGPCLPPFPSEIELQRLRDVERAARVIANVGRDGLPVWDALREALDRK